MVYVIQVCWQLASGIRAWLCDTPLLWVQWKTPVDGRWKSPKHLKFYSKNKFEKLVHLVGFIVRSGLQKRLKIVGNWENTPHLVSVFGCGQTTSACAVSTKKRHLVGTKLATINRSEAGLWNEKREGIWIELEDGLKSVYILFSFILINPRFSEHIWIA